MEETVIDTVRADVLEIGDNTYWGIITSLEDNGDYVVVSTDVLDGETIAFFYTDDVAILGSVYADSI